MRKLSFLLAVLATSFFAVGTPAASADAPVTFEDSVTFHDVQPCSGEHHEITINFSVKLHEHDNNFVVTVQRSGSTSDGFTMVGGNDVFVANDSGVRGHLNDVWHNGTSGDKFLAKGAFALNFSQGEPNLDRFELRCLGK